MPDAIMNDASVITEDELDWDFIDSIVETEKNLPDVMSFDAKFREDCWRQFPPSDDKFDHLNYWWGLKKAELQYENEELGAEQRVRSKTGVPSTANIVFAFTKCMTVRPEIRPWLKVEMDLYARKFFESQEGYEAHRKYGDEMGLGNEYWKGKHRCMSYRGYLAQRYAPHINTANRVDYDIVSGGYWLSIYSNNISSVDDRASLFDVLKNAKIANEFILEKYFSDFRNNEWGGGHE